MYHSRKALKQYILSVNSPTMVSTPTNCRAGPGAPGNTPVTVTFTNLAALAATARRRVFAAQI